LNQEIDRQITCQADRSRRNERGRQENGLRISDHPGRFRVRRRV